METLFDSISNFNQPLAVRVRPRNLDEFFGQKHLIGRGRILRRMLEQEQMSSIIFWGPPGVGKTTLANIIAKQSNARFITFSAVTSGIKDVRAVMQEAEESRHFGQRTLVFIDEIHRFNKAQQDAFLPFVEKSSIILIGATTENPSFEVNSALLSRCKVFTLKQLETDDMIELLRHATEDPLYIARRLIRFASEDIGLADTRALSLTIETFQACQFLGLPECDVHLTEAVIYLSLAPKSNAVYEARMAVLKDVKDSRNEPVPLQLRNATTNLMRDIGYGEGYKYAHSYDEKTTNMQTMPDNLVGQTYYHPSKEGNELRFKERLEYLIKLKKNLK